MKYEITTIDHDENSSPHTQEVEFALLLSHLINTVKQDPEQLRLTIYDFARTKLKNDLSWANEEERKRLLGALETAIRGVERFSLSSDRLERLPPPAQTSHVAPERSAAVPALGAINQGGVPEYGPEPIEIRSGPNARPSGPQTSRSMMAANLVLFAVGGLLAGSVVAATVYTLRTPLLQRLGAGTPPQAPISQAAGPSAPQQAAPPAAPKDVSQPSFPIPTDYGVYALNNGTLSELDILPEHVPDKRVALSTPVTKASRTVLPDGRARFIVFRRDLAVNAPERVDVRVVAQVTRALTFDAKGKATYSPVTGAWNIRNILHQFRVRPVAGNPEMLLIQPENSEFTLPAGRYVLALKNEGYDFTIAGEMVDPSQCLERTDAANGTFYSDCQKQ
jgi:hypothetical protein